jgi:hypothetical protein
MENVYPVPPIRPEDTIARVHASVVTVNNGMLHNVCESIIRRLNKCIEGGLGLFWRLL